MEKLCYKCGDLKNLSEFHNDKNNKDGKSNRCSKCAKEAAKNWRQDNIEKSKASIKSCWERNREKYYNSHKEYALKKKYGLTLKEYHIMVDLSEGVCNLCGREFGVKPYTKPVVDHCHTSGKTRGIICRQCNIGLGAFRDSIRSLENAITYLRENDG